MAEIKIIGDSVEQMYAHWAEQYAIARAFPADKRKVVTDWLRERMKNIPTDYHGDMTFFDYVKDLIEKNKAEWGTSVVKVSFAPIIFHQFGGGMMIRNEMREAGFDETYFGCEMDYIYLGLLEEAVLGEGNRVTKDEPETLEDINAEVRNKLVATIKN